MKQFDSAGRCSLLSLLGGLTTLGLRAVLYATATDGRGLLTASNPMNFLCWLPCIAVVVLAALWNFREQGKHSRRESRRMSLWGAAGSLCTAVGIIVTVLTETDLRPDMLTRVWRALGLTAGICLAAVAIRAIFGKKPVFQLHGAVALFFAVNLANQYRTWTQMPQFQDYGCAMLACVCMTMSAYYRASFEVEGSSRTWRFWNTLAGTFCIGALSHCHAPALYLGGGVWSILSGLPTPSKRVSRFARDAGEQGENAP